jgi:DNA polymerase kappa
MDAAPPGAPPAGAAAAPPAAPPTVAPPAPAAAAAAPPPPPPRPPPPGMDAHYATVFTNAKAGMEGVDAERVKAVVYAASVGSSHFANEARKGAAAAARAAALRACAARLGPEALRAAAAAADTRVAELEAGRDLSRVWLHADMVSSAASLVGQSKQKTSWKPTNQPTNQPLITDHSAN